MSVLYVKMENYPNFFLSEGKSIVSDNTCILDIQVLTSQFHVAGLNVIGVSVFTIFYNTGDRKTNIMQYRLSWDKMRS
jgi:hypothetical protein